ncbi:MAG: hypothetical protein ABSH51_20550 [Solirubrobacteraceae bacterium]|jgi:hypothetical protein
MTSPLSGGSKQRSRRREEQFTAATTGHPMRVAARAGVGGENERRAAPTTAS